MPAGNLMELRVSQRCILAATWVCHRWGGAEMLQHVPRGSDRKRHITRPVG